MAGTSKVERFSTHVIGGTRLFLGKADCRDNSQKREQTNADTHGDGDPGPQLPRGRSIGRPEGWGNGGILARCSHRRLLLRLLKLLLLRLLRSPLRQTRFVHLGHHGGSAETNPTAQTLKFGGLLLGQGGALRIGL